MLRLYNTALLPLRPLVALWAAVRGRDAARRAEWEERRALRLPAPASGSIWLHGSSVGEVGIVTALARGLRDVLPSRKIVASAFTATGRERLPGPPLVDAAFFLPLDFPGLPRRVISRLSPALLALVETELWPNLLRETADDGVLSAVLNGRLSRERMARYRRFDGLYRPGLAGMACVGAQTDRDAERFESLGVPARRLSVTGNIKYDLPVPGGDAAELRRRLRLDPGRPVIAAGSTRPGEEPLILEAFARLRQSHRDAYLLLAPRHPQRFDEVDALLRDSDLRHGRLSGGEDALTAELDVLLVDTLGQLASLYRIAAAAFVGGSLVPLGGHSPLEPAAVGVPVTFGPHTDHFAEPTQALLDAGGALRVGDAAELAEVLDRWLAEPEERRRAGAAAEAVIAANRGALARSVELLRATLEAAP